MNIRQITATSLLSAVTLMSGIVKADALYDLVNDDNGYSYIKFNGDVDAFSFKSDFKSIGNSGKVGYYVMPEGLVGDDLKDYINKLDMDNAEFGKHVNEGIVDLGADMDGDRVGFYLQRNNGDLIRTWMFKTQKGQIYIAFDKNGGHGKDEWMPIGEISVTPHTDMPNGAPLPGVLSMLLLGGAGLGALKLRKRK